MTEPTGVAVLANLNLNAIIKLGNSVEVYGSNEIEGKTIWPARSMKASTWYSLQLFVHLESTGEGKTCLDVQSERGSGHNRGAAEVGGRLKSRSDGQEQSARRRHRARIWCRIIRRGQRTRVRWGYLAEV